PTCPPLEHPDRDIAKQLVLFSPDGHRVAAASRTGSVQVWYLPSGGPVSKPIRHPAGSLNQVAFSPDGALLLTAGNAGAVRVWNTYAGEAVGWPVAHPGPVVGAGFSPDGTRIWTVCKDPSGLNELCTLWECPTRERRTVSTGTPAGWRGAARFHSDSV